MRLGQLHQPQWLDLMNFSHNYCNIHVLLDQFVGYNQFCSGETRINNHHIISSNFIIQDTFSGRYANSAPPPNTHIHIHFNQELPVLLLSSNVSNWRVTTYRKQHVHFILIHSFRVWNRICMLDNTDAFP